MEPKSYYFYEDTELRIVHTTTTCTDSKIASKYKFLQPITIKTTEEAEALDQRAKPCPRCINRERGKAKTLRGYTPPPGFRS